MGPSTRKAAASNRLESERLRGPASSRHGSPARSYPPADISTTHPAPARRSGMCVRVRRGVAVERVDGRGAGEDLAGRSEERILLVVVEEVRLDEARRLVGAAGARVSAVDCVALGAVGDGV